MKRFGFKLILSLLLCLSLLAPTALAEEMTEATAEPAAISAPTYASDQQVFVVPNVNRDYTNADATLRFQHTLIGMLSLFQKQEKVRTALFTKQAEPVLMTGSTLTEEVTFPLAPSNPETCLRSITESYGAKGGHNVVIAL